MGARESIEALLQGPELGARLLEAVLDQLPIAILVVDASSGAVTAASARLYELTGGDIAGGAQLRRLDGTAVTRGTGPLARTRSGGAPAENELYQLVRPDGGVRLVSFTTSAVRDADGEIVAAVGILDDVTERRRRARVEREFIANAAHELRTPLAAIAGAVEVLQAGAKELPRERDLFLAHIERETDRLSRLARALLMIARAQTSAERPRVAVVQLRPLLDDVARTLRVGDGVALSVRCRESLAALTNRDLVEQALGNLAQNATRHTARGAVRLRGRAERDAAVLEVADTGPGLPEDARERAFDRFFRTGGPGEGYGLGLSIARQAVEAVGGTLELESSARGATARIRLPLARLVASE